ncbi:MAG: UDP-N-acetylmuramoyl-L-alanine--D-glutamate ligase [Nitriliruptorales bacterium]|nr:UDP-N-acetylmuramoyl-L-alanine--D-glutamate ligase [Nitriliruptorales bacterium]
MAEAPRAVLLEEIRSALVIGLGASGLAAARLLVDRGVDVVLADDDPARRTDVPGARVHAGRPEELDPTQFDLVVPSPGVPERAPLLQRALAADLPVWSEPELAWRVRPTPLVGITGTNGKTTVTTLVADMLDRSGINAVACGNIGQPMADVVADLVDSADVPVLVAELSSFQLRFAHALTPSVAVVLNVAEDHLDWHGSFEAYAMAKARLLQNVGPDAPVVVGPDDVARQVVEDAGVVPIETSADGPVARGVGVADGWLVAWPDAVRLVDVARLPSRAPHVIANAAVSAAAARVQGASDEGIRAALEAWRIGPHRMEVVARQGGVTWIDDSKATNVHATIAALDSADSIVWVAGGQAKGTDLRPLGGHLGGVRYAVLLGESADALAAICETSTVPVARAGTMQQAVAMAADVARPGDVVLLSPAGASFDLFDGYADRGDQFAAAVRRLLEAQGERT